MQKMIDISAHQGNFYPETAKAAGITQVMLKAGYGPWEEHRFHDFAVKCKEAKLPRHAYGFALWHMAENNRNDVEEARRLMRAEIKKLTELAKREGIEGWLAVDQELEYDRKGRAITHMGLNRKTNTLLLNEACSWIRLAGYEPLLYASISWMQQYVDLEQLNCKVWPAWYYRNMEPLRFENALQFTQLTGENADFMNALGDKLAAWQFSSAGYGPVYGVDSQNLDKNWLYQMPKGADDMEFVKVEGKVLRVTSDKNPACQVFSEPDRNAVLGNLAKEERKKVLAYGEEEILGGTVGRWVQIESFAGAQYVWAAPDRCTIEDSTTVREVAAELRRLADMLEEM